MEKTAVKMLRSGWLKKEQIVELTGLSPERVDEIEKSSRGINPPATS